MKSQSQNARNREYDRNYREKNKEAIRAKDRERYRNNPDDWKNRNFKRLYGITLEEFNKLLEAQSFGCKICGSSQPNGNGTFHVDHCHKTGKIRGILCHFCNLLLGNAKDDIKILQSAVDYLKETA